MMNTTGQDNKPARAREAVSSPVQKKTESNSKTSGKGAVNGKAARGNDSGNPLQNMWTRLRGHKPAETRELAVLAEKLEQLEKINDKVNSIAVNMERMGIAEYVEMLHHPRRLLWANFLIGLARGFGMAVGFALLGALALYLLQQLVLLNMPLIGDFIADIVFLVQQQLNAH